jgi:hypothetical protein
MHPSVCLAWASTAILSAVSGSITAYASDIGGEVLPPIPVCRYDAGGNVAAGFPAACAGPLTILSITGGTAMLIPNKGTEPFLLNESITSLGRSTVQFGNTFGPYWPVPSDPRFRGDPTGSEHVLGRDFDVTIENLTNRDWYGFYFELIVPGRTSAEDTLSFGQIDENPAVLYKNPTSSVFALSDFEGDERDSLRFDGGPVAHGQSVTFKMGPLGVCLTGVTWEGNSPGVAGRENAVEVLVNTHDLNVITQNWRPNVAEALILPSRE